MQIDLPAPIPLHVLQTRAVVDVVAQHDDVRLQQRVVLRRGGVVELEAVPAVVHADVVDEGLVDVVQRFDVGEGGVGDAGTALGEAAVMSSRGQLKSMGGQVCERMEANLKNVLLPHSALPSRRIVTVGPSSISRDG